MDKDKPRSFEDKAREAYPMLSEAEIAELRRIYHYAGGNTEKIATDLAGELKPDFCRALTGRYWIFCKLHDDQENWDDFNLEYLDFSAHLTHEPAIIAAALAIRPVERPEWELVEAWSWVYRHALMLDVDIGDFKDWCEHQNPEASRAFILTELMRAGNIEALSNTAGPTIFDAANGDA